MHVVPIPALADNYIWLLHDNAGDAFVVDPGEAGPVHAALRGRQLTLRAIFLTHHHADHIGGAVELRDAYNVPLYAPDDRRIEGATNIVRDGDVIDLQAPKSRFSVMSVPGHTLSHIVYVGEEFVFTGDTLFSMGCGRMFEGTAEQMYASLQRIASLPSDLRICCGHEYTEANARFATSVEPDNDALNMRAQEVSRLRGESKPSLPVTLASELSCNPFLRVDSHTVRTWCRSNGHAHATSVERFAALRTAKDSFRA